MSDLGRGDRIPLRREYKFMLPKSRLPELRHHLRASCDRDRNAGPDGTYTARTLYFDAPDMRLFNANEIEASKRFKARVRGYPDTPEAPVFVELKHRDGDIISKVRAKLPKDQLAAALSPGGGFDASPELGAFLFQMIRHDLRPVLLAQYRREAWMSRVEEYARVSIDTEIVTQATDRISMDATGDWRPVDHALQTWTKDSCCVLELKWADAIPRWMQALAQSMGLLRAAFSKYCYGMENLAEDHFRDYRRASSPWA